MNPFRLWASSPRRFSAVRNHPRSTRLRIESLEQRRLLAIDTLGAGRASPWQNGASPADVNADGHVSAQDAMLVINDLNAHGTRSLAASIGRDAFLASTLRTAANAAPVFLDTNGDGMLTPQDVALIVNQLNETAEPLVQVRLEITDAGGNPITQVNVNDSFQLRAYVFDLRTTGNTGVFSAYSDVTYNPTLASVAGSIVHSPDYPNSSTGTALPGGLLNEVGGFANSISQLGPNERLLFTVPYTATAAGLITFAADAAEDVGSVVSLYDMNPLVPPMQVMYGTTSLVVGPPDFSIADVSMAEGSSGMTAMEFTVTLSHEYEGQVSVQYSLQAATATSDIDFLAASGTLTFDPGQVSKTITVEVLGDTLDETNETFLVNLTNPSVGTLADAQATGTITDDDPVPTLSINSPAALTENDGVTPLVFTVTLSAMSGQDVVVHFTTANGTATAGQDYVAQTGGMLTIPAGQLTKTIEVDLFDDTADEPDQTFTVALSAPGNATLAPGQETGTGTILDNDDPPILTIASPAPITEGNAGTKSLNFTVTLSAASDNIVPFTINTEDGTAFADQDYVDRNETRTIAAGQTSTTFAITINGDGNVEQDETFGVRLSDPTNATIGVGMDVATGTITNDDSLIPTVSIISPDAVAENAGPINFTVMLSAISGQDVVVRFKTDNGTAMAGQDYVAQADGMLTIPAGQLTGTINVNLFDDTADEPDQTFTVTLLPTTTGATLAAGQATGTGTILDNDAEPTLSIAPAAVMEGNAGVKALDFTVTLSAVSDKDVFFSFITAGNTASEDDDYDAGNGTLTIPAGQSTRTITINVRGDTDVEADETFRVDLSDPTNATFAVDMATGTITNDDLPSISIADASITEGDSGATQLVFTVTLDRPNPLAPVSVQFQTAPGTATSAVDFLAANGTLTFDPNVTTKTITVDIIGDTLGEPNETFVVNLANPSGGVLGDTQATGTITDDDVPMLSIGTPGPQVENDGVTPLAFTVTLSEVSNQDVVVHYSTANGTATAGHDFTAQTNGMLTIPAGQLTGAINVGLLDDTADEADETFTVMLLPATTGATIAAGQGTATGTITDNDAAPTVSIANAVITEGNTGTTPLVFSVTLSAVSGQDVLVHFATIDGTAMAGSDYVAQTGTLTIPAGQLTGMIAVVVNGDATPESNETVRVNLSAPEHATIATGSATGTILNDEVQVVVAAQVGQVTETTGTQPSLVFVVNVVGDPGDKVVTVDYATTPGGSTALAGKDYVPAAGTLTFEPGQRSKTVTVSVLDDLLDEATEFVQLSLSNPSNATIPSAGSAFVASILDNDPTPTVSIADASVVEGASGTTPLVFTLTLSAPSGQLVTVDFASSGDTAVEGLDFVPVAGADANDTAVSFIPGETTKTIIVEVNGDTMLEPNETFKLTLSNAVNATIARATAIGTILDDDQPTFAGFVYNDLNRNGVKDPLETGIAGVPITLSGMDSMGNPVNLTQTTGVDGFYRFGGLMPGDYMVVETHPQDHTDGAETPGGAGVTSSASDRFMASLATGDQMENNNFGEYGLTPQAINKTLLFASMRR